MHSIDLDAHWSEIRLRADKIVSREPALQALINETVLNRNDLAECLTYRLVRKLVKRSESIEVIHETFIGVFSQNKKILEQIDELIDDNNLQFVEHDVKESIKDDTINIVFNIYEGKKTLIERVNVTGNTITNENVIRGELLVDEGDPFTNLNLEKSRLVQKRPSPCP